MKLRIHSEYTTTDREYVRKVFYRKSLTFWNGINKMISIIPFRFILYSCEFNMLCIQTKNTVGSWRNWRGQAWHIHALIKLRP